jgi:hypothetical protein
LGKRSKAGKQALILENGQYKTVRGPRPDDVLQTVYENGEVLVFNTLDEVRARADAHLQEEARGVELAPKREPKNPGGSKRDSRESLAGQA